MNFSVKMYLHFWDGIFLVFFLAFYLFLRHRRRSRSTADYGTTVPTSVMRAKRSKRCRERTREKEKKKDFAQALSSAACYFVTVTVVVHACHQCSIPATATLHIYLLLLLLLFVLWLGGKRFVHLLRIILNRKMRYDTVANVFGESFSPSIAFICRVFERGGSYVWVCAIALLWSLRVCIGFGYILKLQNTLA